MPRFLVETRLPHEFSCWRAENCAWDPLTVVILQMISHLTTSSKCESYYLGETYKRYYAAGKVLKVRNLFATTIPSQSVTEARTFKSLHFESVYGHHP